MICCGECSSDGKHVDIGIKLSQVYLHQGEHDEALSLCERLMQLSCVSDDDDLQLSLSHVIASAAAATHSCSDQRRRLVSLLHLSDFVLCDICNTDIFSTMFMVTNLLGKFTQFI